MELKKGILNFNENFDKVNLILVSLGIGFIQIVGNGINKFFVVKFGLF